jgi:hypothetical protein
MLESPEPLTVFFGEMLPAALRDQKDEHQYQRRWLLDLVCPSDDDDLV